MTHKEIGPTQELLADNMLASLDHARDSGLSPHDILVTISATLATQAKIMGLSREAIYYELRCIAFAFRPLDADSE